MTLTLTIEGADLLENGQPGRIELDRHGAAIGRSPHADWSLPDPRKVVSSHHCEISYRDGEYWLVDHSTNGTYVNGAADRLAAGHSIAHGDRIDIGHYAIFAHRSDAPTPAVRESSEPGADSWGNVAPTAAGMGAGADDAGWAEPPDEIRGKGDRWQTDPAPAKPPTASAWDLPAPVSNPSAWSSDTPRASSLASDVWTRLFEESGMDWSRGDPVSVGTDADWIPPKHPTAAPAPAVPVDEPQPTPGSASMPPEPSAAVTDGWEGFVEQSGLPADRLRRSPAETLAAAGVILRQAIGGLMLMVEARARAKAQLGVQATALELDGNNPLKFIRSPERALLQLLDEPEPGFMPADRAVEDAFLDVQAHQMATLSAMRGALDGTLARFSPAAIRARVGKPGRLERQFPALHRARQWEIYERDFEGVVQGASEAFMDLFAKEFRHSYDRHVAAMKAQRRDDPPG